MRNYTRMYARAHTHTHKSRSHIHCSCISVGLPVCLWVFLPSFLYCQALCNICLTVSVLVSELRAWLFVLGCCLNWTAGVSVVIVTKCFQRPAYFFIFVLFMYTYCTRSFILVRILGRYLSSGLETTFTVGRLFEVLPLPNSLTCFLPVRVL